MLSWTSSDSAYQRNNRYSPRSKSFSISFSEYDLSVRFLFLLEGRISSSSSSFTSPTTLAKSEVWAQLWDFKCCCDSDDTPASTLTLSRNRGRLRLPPLFRLYSWSWLWRRYRQQHYFCFLYFHAQLFLLCVQEWNQCLERWNHWTPCHPIHPYLP
jgi:hypothetical protein